MKVISLRLPEAIYNQIKSDALLDDRSINGFIVQKLSSDTKVIPQEITENKEYVDKCECGNKADWESEQDWETGEVRYYCDYCIHKKGDKMYKILTSKMKKL